MEARLEKTLKTVVPPCSSLLVLALSACDQVALALLLQVTKFLSDARNLSDAALLGQAPTLLGDSAQRRQVLVLLLAAARSVPDSLCMAHRLCRALRLELDPALPEVAARLTAAGRSDQLLQLLTQLLETERLRETTLAQLVKLLPPGHACVSLLLGNISDPALKVRL